MENWSCSSPSICGQRILGAALGALGTELAWAFVAAQVEHVPFLEALLRRLVAQFWDSFGRTVAVQLRFDAAVLTAIAAYVDRFMCDDVGKLQLLAWAISRATRDIPVWMLSPGVSVRTSLKRLRGRCKMDPSDARDIFTASLDAAGALSGSAIRPRLLQECSVWMLRAPGSCIVNCGDCFFGVDGCKAHKGLAAALGFALCTKPREFLRAPYKKCQQRPRGSVARGATRVAPHQIVVVCSTRTRFSRQSITRSRQKSRSSYMKWACRFLACVSRCSHGLLLRFSHHTAGETLASMRGVQRQFRDQKRRI